jgi:hypothetical protein
MYEIFPVIASIVLAQLIRLLDSSRAKPVALAAGISWRSTSLWCWGLRPQRRFSWLWWLRALR